MAWNEKIISKPQILFQNEEPNEITKSLKLFVAMTFMNPDYSDIRVPIHVIEKDFENNGVHVDESDNLQKNLRSPERERQSYSRETGFKKSSHGFFKETKRTPKKKSANASQFCVFCENNKESPSFVRSHAVRDSLGRVVCPKLRSYKCPLCHAVGDNAHTIKYCPKRPIITMEDTILAQRLGKLFPFSNIINILNV